MDSTVGLNYNPVFWFVEIIELQNGVIIWKHRKGGGHEWHSTLFLQCRAKCWSIFEYLLYITIRIFKISIRNCVSSFLSTHYRTFLFTGQFDLTKAQSLNPAQKSIGTPKFYCDYSTELVENEMIVADFSSRIQNRNY